MTGIRYPSTSAFPVMNGSMRLVEVDTEDDVLHQWRGVLLRRRGCASPRHQTRNPLRLCQPRAHHQLPTGHQASETLPTIGDRRPTRGNASASRTTASGNPVGKNMDRGTLTDGSNVDDYSGFHRFTARLRIAAVDRRATCYQYYPCVGVTSLRK